jgi:hypothetical protein
MMCTDGYERQIRKALKGRCSGLLKVLTEDKHEKLNIVGWGILEALPSGRFLSLSAFELVQKSSRCQ